MKNYLLVLFVQKLNGGGGDDDFIYILYTIFQYVYKEHTVLNNISADYLFNIKINKLLNCYASNKIKLIDSIYIHIYINKVK